MGVGGCGFKICDGYPDGLDGAGTDGGEIETGTVGGDGVTGYSMGEGEIVGETVNGEM